MSKKYRVVLDTETANGLSFPLPYDFSYQISVGNEMRPVVARQFIIREIFLDSDLMDTAYYASKTPEYWRRIWAHEAQLVTMYEARKIFLEDCAEYNVKEIYAYNMSFDYRALNNLMRKVTNNKYRYFFPKKFRMCCIWNMATDAFLATRKYYDFVVENNYFSECGNILTNAECAYNFITKNVDFSEVHIGIDDVYIETEILKYCLLHHVKMDKKPNSACWRKAQKYNKVA